MVRIGRKAGAKKCDTTKQLSHVGLQSEQKGITTRNNHGPTYMRTQERHVLQSVEELVAEAVQQGKEGYAAVELRKIYQALARAKAFLRE